MSTPTPVVIVTGLSGAGKSSALGALEDLGYEVIENLPMDLIEAAVLRAPVPASDDQPHGLAINVDSRSRGFSSRALVASIARLADQAPVAPCLLFLTCDDDELSRRYTETRRRHPMAGDRPVIDGIALERRLLDDALKAADQIIDTSQINIHDLKRQIAQKFSLEGGRKLSTTIMSFSFKRGVPRDADLLFDVRFLSNPHWVPGLRPMTGRDPAVAAHIAADPHTAEFLERTGGLLKFLHPLYEKEGKAHLTIGIGCTGGRHRSVFVAEYMVKLLRENGHRVTVLHRDTEFA